MPWNVWTMPSLHSVAWRQVMRDNNHRQSLSSTWNPSALFVCCFQLFFFLLLLFVHTLNFTLCDGGGNNKKIWISLNCKKKRECTYPNRWHHFVRLCWQSINQLSSIECRVALTIWMSGAGVFQQIFLSSTCLLLIDDDSIFVMRLYWWRNEKNIISQRMQLIHRQNRMMKPLVSSIYLWYYFILFDYCYRSDDECVWLTRYFFLSFSLTSGSLSLLLLFISQLLELSCVFFALFSLFNFNAE